MNSLKTVVLLGFLTGLFLCVGELAGGPRGMTYALIFTGIMNFVSYFFSDKLVLAMYRAQPVTREQDPQFFDTVQVLAQKARIPMPRLYVVPSPALNAFATGRNPQHAAVAATSGLLQVMNREELEGVLAHELSHVLNRDTLVSTVAATLAGSIGYVARLALWFGTADRRDRNGGGNPILALLLLILSPIAAFLIQMAVSRSREYGADESGARLVGYPQGLASALRKLDVAAQQRPLDAVPSTAHLFIVNPLRGGFFARMFSTHPPVEDRIRRLMEIQPR